MMMMMMHGIVGILRCRTQHCKPLRRVLRRLARSWLGRCGAGYPATWDGFSGGKVALQCILDNVDGMIDDTMYLQSYQSPKIWTNLSQPGQFLYVPLLNLVWVYMVWCPKHLYQTRTKWCHGSMDTQRPSVLNLGLICTSITLFERICRGNMIIPCSTHYLAMILIGKILWFSWGMLSLTMILIGKMNDTQVRFW